MERYQEQDSSAGFAGWLVLLAALIAIGCGARQAAPHGDVHEGECRRDADCAEGERCTEERSHLRSQDTGEIVGDEVLHRCVPAPPDAD